MERKVDFMQTESFSKNFFFSFSTDLQIFCNFDLLSYLRLLKFTRSGRQARSAKKSNAVKFRKIANYQGSQRQHDQNRE